MSIMQTVQHTGGAGGQRSISRAGFFLFLTLALVGGEARAQANGEISLYLQEITQLAEEALAASRAAEKAASVAEVKQGADAVFETIWGVRSGLADEAARGAASEHGWKVRWQVTGAEFDSAFVARYGTEPPAIADLRQLGLIGRGRYVRSLLEGTFYRENASNVDPETAERVVASLNNAIGWMKMDDGVTKGERQPRVDLTRVWDAPPEFWLSTADTGWLHEVFAQAMNILKTDYAGDVATARQHAAGMTRLIEKALNGEDANGDGTIEPVMMEGGLYTALQQAERAGLVSR